jgi:hypothetical protein
VNRSSSTVPSLAPPVTGTLPARPDGALLAPAVPVIRLVGGALTARKDLCGTPLVLPERLGGRGFVKGGGPRVPVADAGRTPLT